MKKEKRAARARQKAQAANKAPPRERIILPGLLRAICDSLLSPLKFAWDLVSKDTREITHSGALVELRRQYANSQTQQRRNKLLGRIDKHLGILDATR